MSAVCWSHLLPDPLRMGRLSTDDLDAIERTAECELERRKQPAK